jgi:Uma2 family endonuclease
LELVRKRDLYERFEVPEYWYVDLDAERVEAYRLIDGRYGLPALQRAGDELTSPVLPGLALNVGELLCPVEPGGG